MAIASAIGAMGTPFMFDGPVEPKQQGIVSSEQYALEETLQNVKKTLWDIERHTESTQSRLDVNNQSGPAFYAQKISKWAADPWGLDIMNETLPEIRDAIEELGASKDNFLTRALESIKNTLSNSAIARHSYSPLETLLQAQHKEQEKWNVSTGGSFLGTHAPGDPLIKIPQGDKDDVAKKKEEEKEKSWFSKLLTGIFGKKESVEEEVEGTKAEKKKGKEEKKQTGFLKSISAWAEKRKKESGIFQLIADNWGKMLLIFAALKLPLQDWPTVWKFMKSFWRFVIDDLIPFLKDVFMPIIKSLKNFLVNSMSEDPDKSWLVFDKKGWFSKLTGIEDLRQEFLALGIVLYQFKDAILAAAGTLTTFAAIKMMRGVPLPTGGKGGGVPFFGGGGKGGPKVDPRQMAFNFDKKPPKPGGLFNKIIKQFPRASGFLMRLGPEILMPFIMSPYGWATILALVAGGVAWYYWDKGLGKSVEDMFKKQEKEVDTTSGKKATVKQQALLNRIKHQQEKLAGGDTHRGLDREGFGQGKTRKDIITGLQKELADTGWNKETTPSTETTPPATAKGFKPTTQAEAKANADFPDDPEDVEETRQAMDLEKRKAGTYQMGVPVPKGAVHSPGASARAAKKIAKAKARRSKKTTKTRTGRKIAGEWVVEGQPLTKAQLSAIDMSRTMGNIVPVTKEEELGLATSTKDKHKAVQVSGADMSGVSWNKLGGRDTVEEIILSTWNQSGVSAPPTFTSGFRKKDDDLSIKNPFSKHIQRTAFDLRSKDLGGAAPGIFTNLMTAFNPLGITGQHETGDVNAKNRTGEHFHFQLAARGFEGVVGKDGPRGFIVGEAGEELVRIQPLVSPDAKMNAMNALSTENQTARGQSGLAISTVHSEQNYNAPTTQILNDRIDNKAIPGQHDIA